MRASSRIHPAAGPHFGYGLAQHERLAAHRAGTGLFTGQCRPHPVGAGALQRFPLQSMQGVLAKNAFGLYDNVSIWLATKSYCVGLARAAVWESEHVDLRIADFYRSKANSWEGHL